MTRKITVLLVAVVVAALAVVLTSLAYVSEVHAQAQSRPASGPWTVSADGMGGYLVNTSTGEVWRLKDDMKFAVREAAGPVHPAGR